MPRYQRQDSGDPRVAPAHVRFAESDDYIPPPRRLYSGDLRSGSGSVPYEVEVRPSRGRRRLYSGDEPDPRRYYVAPEQRYHERRGRPSRPRARDSGTYDDYRQPSIELRRPTIAARFTESPPPIDEVSPPRQKRRRDPSWDARVARPVVINRAMRRNRTKSSESEGPGVSYVGEEEKGSGSDADEEEDEDDGDDDEVESDKGSERVKRYPRREYSRSPSVESDSRSHWSRPRTRGRYRASSITSDDFDPYARFNFVVPTRSVTESSRDDDSDLDSPGIEEKSAPGGETVTIAATIASNVTSRHSKATLVHASQYTGNAELGGTHTASLTVLHDPKGLRKSLFRWLHVQQDVMNFDEFWTEVSRLSGLSDLEKSALKRLNSDVRKTCVKPRTNPKGVKVGYLDPRSYEVPLKTFAKKSSTIDADSTTGSARWICIPYFSLERYSGLLSASNLASFPAQTLLQMQYSRNTPQRDMEQAVCQLGMVNRGECFHVSQLWCIVIDNSLLVTCGTVSQSELFGEELDMHEEPSREATSTSGQGKILVSYGESVMWSFAAEECQSWFGFISRFQVFWPQIVEFRRKNEIITAKTWPKILQLAAHPRANIKIKLQIVRRPQPPPRAVLEEDSETEAATAASQPEPLSMTKKFHALALTPGDSHKKIRKNSIANIENLRAQLKAAEKFLMHETSFSNRKEYKGAKESNRDEVLNYLKGIAGKVDEDGTDEVRRAYEERIDIFSAADLVHGLFLPNGFDDPTSKKFWGSLKEIVKLRDVEPFDDSDGYDLDSVARDMRASLRDLTSEVRAFMNVLSQANAEEIAKIPLPREFATAWLYLVMSMVFGAANEGVWNNRFLRASSLISAGMEKIMQGLSDIDLLEKATVLPLEILSLISMGLLKDQVGKSDDICETYSQYLNSLETAITTKPSDRTYQHRIDLVQQEMTAIKRVLAKQRYLIGAIRNSLATIETTEVATWSREQPPRDNRFVESIAVRRAAVADYSSAEKPSRQRMHWQRPSPVYGGAPAYGSEWAPYTEKISHYDAVTQRADDYMEFDDEFAENIASAHKLSPTDPGGLRGLLLTECSQIIEQREFEFRRYSEYANDLERALSFKMETTKDRQENAIFAFTLVTIIFLPLSAISSIFGMNTTDVRDMEYSQWLYWVCALPVTFVVIIAGLWGMGELGNVARWFMRKPNHSAGGYGTMVVPQTFEQAYMSPMAMQPPPPPPPPLAPQPLVVDYGPPAYTPAYRMARRRTEGRHYRA